MLDSTKCHQMLRTTSADQIHIPSLADKNTDVPVTIMKKIHNSCEKYSNYCSKMFDCINYGFRNIHEKK